MDNPIKTFEPNLNGRDFVIGDLHGALRCYERLIEHIKFDPTVDRMFSVGDLVDRGDDSLGCLRLLKNGLNAVLSNHETMMLDAFNGGRNGKFWRDEVGYWARFIVEKAQAADAFRAGRIDFKPRMGQQEIEFFNLLPYVEKLPYLITINHKNGKKFHIIHAEILPYFEVTDEVLADPDQFMELATIQTKDGDAIAWSRHMFGNFYKHDPHNIKKIIRTVAAKGLDRLFNDKLSHIISGHTIVQRPMTIIGQTNIDTGAYYTVQKGGKYGEEKVPSWAGLTCVCLDDWKFYRATPEYCVDSTPIVINRADLR